MGEGLGRGEAVQDEHGPVVDLGDGLVHVVLADLGEVGAFGEIAAELAVFVLVAAALPGAVGVGEVAGHAQGLVHDAVAAGLATVVPGAADAGGGGQGGVDVQLGPAGGRGALVGHEAGDQETGAAFHAGVQAGLGGYGADDRVRLPMTELRPGVRPARAQGDGRASGDARPFGPPPLASAPPRLGAAQVAPQLPFTVGHWCDGRIVGDDQYRDAFSPACFLQQAQNLLAGLVVQGTGGFVAQQEIRVLGKRPGDGDPLLFPAGKLGGKVVQSLAQSHILKGLPRIQGMGGYLAGQLDILQSGQIRHQIVVLEHEAGACPPIVRQIGVRCCGDVSSVDNDRAFIGTIHTAQNVQSG